MVRDDAGLPLAFQVAEGPTEGAPQSSRGSYCGRTVGAVPIHGDRTVDVSLYQGPCGDGIGAGYKGTITVEFSDRR